MPRTRAQNREDSQAAQMYALNTQFQSNRRERNATAGPSNLRGGNAGGRRSAAPSAGPRFPGGVDALDPNPRLDSPFLGPRASRQQFQGSPRSSYRSGRSREDADAAGQQFAARSPSAVRNLFERMDSSDDNEPNYSPGHTHRSGSAATSHLNYQSDYTDFSILREDNPDLRGGCPLGSMYVNRLGEPVDQGFIRGASRFVGREDDAPRFRHLPVEDIPEEHASQIGSRGARNPLPQVQPSVQPSVSSVSVVNGSLGGQRSHYSQIREPSQEPPRPREAPRQREDYERLDYHSGDENPGVRLPTQGRKRRPENPPTPDRFYQRRRPDVVQDDHHMPRVPPAPLHAPAPIRAHGLMPAFVNQAGGFALPPVPPARDIQVVPQVVYRPNGKLRVPFPKVTQSRRPEADPAGLLTGVSHEVIEVLRNGWNVVIPLGHFAHRYNPLISNHVPSSSSDEGLPDIPLMDMTINEWNEIKRNMPRALREHLIPEHEVVPGTEEAMAAADMIETFFGIVDSQSRLTDEVVPLMIYADQKITFWRFRPERMERMDVFDHMMYRHIFEEWKKKVAERKEHELREKFFKGSNSFHAGTTSSSSGGKSSSTSLRPFPFNKFQGQRSKFRCIFCGGEHHSRGIIV
ncbi:hypothetical protein C8R42DRAFT_646409 [Lentinula raphanica]|nr:hypothetical protein C8R42DRAFT_646409 [Lentinula raphanica]